MSNGNVKINIDGSDRQLGTQRIAANIEEALSKAGYEDVTVVSDGPIMNAEQYRQSDATYGWSGRDRQDWQQVPIEITFSFKDPTKPELKLFNIVGNVGDWDSDSVGHLCTVQATSFEHAVREAVEYMVKKNAENKDWFSEMKGVTSDALKFIEGEYGDYADDQELNTYCDYPDAFAMIDLIGKEWIVIGACEAKADNA